MDITWYNYIFILYKPFEYGITRLGLRSLRVVHQLLNGVLLQVATS